MLFVYKSGMEIEARGLGYPMPCFLNGKMVFGSKSRWELYITQRNEKDPRVLNVTGFYEVFYEN